MNQAHQLKNWTDSDLEREAYREGNLLAQELYDRLVAAQHDVDEITKEKEEAPSIEKMIDTSRYLQSAKWTKFGETTTRYVMDGFHEDTNPFHHHIEVSPHEAREKCWRIEIHAGNFGEHVVKDAATGNYKTAQKYAIECAFNVLSNGVFLSR